MATRSDSSRPQRAVVVTGMPGFVLIILALQLWRLTASMNAYLGGDHAVIWPAAFASLACLIPDAGLLRDVLRLEAPRR